MHSGEWQPFMYTNEVRKEYIVHRDLLGNIPEFASCSFGVLVSYTELVLFPFMTVLLYIYFIGYFLEKPAPISLLLQGINCEDRINCGRNPSVQRTWMFLLVCARMHIYFSFTNASGIQTCAEHHQVGTAVENENAHIFPLPFHYALTPDINLVPCLTLGICRSRAGKKQIDVKNCVEFH